jgi:hypothetical protein
MQQPWTPGRKMRRFAQGMPFGQDARRQNRESEDMMPCRFMRIKRTQGQTMTGPTAVQIADDAMSQR